MEINTIGLGKRIREQRKKLGLTIEALAEECSKSESFIGNIERGDDIPSLNTLLLIVNILSTSFEYLLQDTLNTNVDIKSSQFHGKINNELKTMTESQKKVIYDIIKSVKEYD